MEIIAPALIPKKKKYVLLLFFLHFTFHQRRLVDILFALPPALDFLSV